MSTLARVAMTLPQGRFKSVYTHRAGHPAGLGQTLAHHYRSADRVARLLGLGDLSQVQPRLAPPPSCSHTFDHPLPGVSVAYGRDRGYRGSAALISHTFTALVTVAMQVAADYIYVFRRGRWRYVEVPWEAGMPMPEETDLVEISI